MCSKTQFGTGTMKKKSFLRAAGIAALTAVVLIGCGGKNHSTGGGGRNNDTADTTYIITFDPNGGTVAYDVDTTGVDGRLDSLPTPTRNDYAFTGWFTAITGGTAVTDSTVFRKDTTIYAQWTPADYYVILFNANGGSGASTGEMTGPDGRLASLPTPTKWGYAFKGWFTADTGGTAVTTSTVFTANTTIYAQWSVAYTITFNANGGTVTPLSGTTGANWTLDTLPTPTRGDSNTFTFNGWFTADTGGTAVTTNTIFGANVTIYAQWTFIPTFVDSRDNKTYRRVIIGTQTWMAQNLNYEASGSVCYENSADSCAKYGRLYDWVTAMDIDTSYNSSLWGGNDVKHQGVCPVGWHIPSDVEWTTLTTFAGGMSTAGTKLKSPLYWYLGAVPAGTDDYGFSALPGGYGQLNFYSIGEAGKWCSVMESYPDLYPVTHVWGRGMFSHEQYVAKIEEPKSTMLSVRCVQD